MDDICGKVIRERNKQFKKSSEKGKNFLRQIKMAEVFEAIIGVIKEGQDDGHSKTKTDATDFLTFFLDKAGHWIHDDFDRLFWDKGCHQNLYTKEYTNNKYFCIRMVYHVKEVFLVSADDQYVIFKMQETTKKIEQKELYQKSEEEIFVFVVNFMYDCFAEI